MRNRAWRIHQKNRMRSHARKIVKNWGYSKEKEQIFTVKFADNMAICSCHMCRSPRRSAAFKGDEKLTMAERKAKLNFKDQVCEL